MTVVELVALEEQLQTLARQLENAESQVSELTSAWDVLRKENLELRAELAMWRARQRHIEDGERDVCGPGSSTMAMSMPMFPAIG